MRYENTVKTIRWINDIESSRAWKKQKLPNATDERSRREEAKVIKS